MIWDGRTFLSFINTTPKLQNLEHRVRTSGPPSRLDDLTICLTSQERDGEMQQRVQAGVA